MAVSFVYVTVVTDENLYAFQILVATIVCMIKL